VYKGLSPQQDHMKTGRNDPCPCGSGKKFKNCHLKAPFLNPPKSTPYPQFTLQDQAVILAAEAADIFGLTRGKSWEDVRRDINDDQIRTFYRVVARLHNPAIYTPKILPAPSAALRALYLGDVGPTDLVRNVFRFGLYADEIIIVDPFQNPNCTRPPYNPILHPEQYKSDTLKLVYMLAMLSPWILAGVVYFVPHPSELHTDLFQHWRNEVIDGRKQPPPQEELDQEFERHAPDFERTWERAVGRMPAEDMVRMFMGQDPSLTPERALEMHQYLRAKNDADPMVPINQDMPDGAGELMIMRGGTSRDLALYLAQVTGAFPYTDSPFRWKRLHEAMESEESKFWGSLSTAFSQLDFRFLDQVDASFAVGLRDDGRLESFRAFMRRMWKDVQASSGETDIVSASRYLKDELNGEYEKAQADWKAIDQAIVKGVGAASGIGAVAAGLLHGNMELSLGLGFCVPSVATLINSTMQRKSFKKTNAMSVLLDLHKKT
jgi:hypothetical protein